MINQQMPGGRTRQTILMAASTLLSITVTAKPDVWCGM